MVIDMEKDIVEDTLQDLLETFKNMTEGELKLYSLVYLIQLHEELSKIEQHLKIVASQVALSGFR